MARILFRLGMFACACLLAAPSSSAEPPLEDQLRETYAAYRDAVGREDFAAAYPLAERAFELGRERYGPGHERTAVLAINLGDLHRIHARPALAEPLYARGIATLARREGSASPELLAPLVELAEIYEALGSEQRSRAHYRRAIEVVQKLYGAGHRATASMLVTVGLFEATSGNVPAARRYFERALAIRRALFGQTHPEVAEALFFLGKLDLEAGRYDEAAPRYREAAEIWRTASPSDKRIVEAGARHLALVEEHLRAARVEVAARPIERVSPEYPSRARRLGVEGWVALDFTVTADGQVVGAAVVRSEPAGIFDDAAVSALSAWRYEPRTIGGRPVDSPNMEAVLRFVLTD